MPVKTLALILPLFALSACGSEPAPKPAPTATATVPATPLKPTLPPPDQATFSKVFAKACPEAAKVAITSCRAEGMGATTFICEYGLGNDKYLRNTAKISQKDGAYVLDNPEKTCAADAAKQG